MEVTATNPRAAYFEALDALERHQTYCTARSCRRCDRMAKELAELYPAFRATV